VDAFESGSSRALADLEHYKNLYDQRLLSEDYSDTNYYIIRFASIPDIMCSAVLFPEVDFHGNVLQDLLRIGSISERGAHLTYSLIATDEGGAAVFSWIGDDLAPIQFVNSLDKLKDQEIPNALLRFNFEFFENTAISPDWWDNLTMEQQQLISNRLSKAVSFNTERKPDCLVDDGLRAVTWSVISRETNLSF